MTSDLDNVFETVASRLPEAGVRCLMIGGHAVNHYGVLRATQDIDFMIASADADAVRTVMRAAGFSNIAEHESVLFFNRPGSPLRVDFLKTDPNTMAGLLQNAVQADAGGERPILVPALQDLIAMKLFALATGGPTRQDKDFSDIVHLVIENRLETATVLEPLCRKFASPRIFKALSARIAELTHA